MTLDKQADAFLNTLNEMNIKICIVTNLTTQFQIQKLITLGLHRRIDALVTSEEGGLEKPHARLFEIGLEKLGLSAHDVVMIGDDEEKDIAGAQALGIKTVKVTVDD
jgi:putative hydrolase of the HAD superfamily